jgi:biopolymer transport protein TolR
MGASGLGGGGKKNLNVELNLVPFIDLLSTLICFLLITAVWQQISALSTNSAATTSSESVAPPNEKKVELNISLLLDHIEAAEDKNVIKIPNVAGEPDYATLGRVLVNWKSRYPTRSDLILYSDSQAQYKQLIKLMDIMVENHFEDVGVNTN